MTQAQLSEKFDEIMKHGAQEDWHASKAEGLEVVGRHSTGEVWERGSPGGQWQPVKPMRS
jgi:hypothetical protein